MAATPTPASTLAYARDTERQLLGHPRGLFILFFAELWERFSFYGMKALLILYLVNYLLWTQGSASTVMAWYTGLVYFTPLFGGIVADRWLGARWSVVAGGGLMAIGHFLLAFEPLPFFFSGLGFLVVGCGLLKPNISTQVGALYHPDDRRRDSAFSIFYMGINAGAFVGPLLCGWLRIRYGYHYGFAAAGVGMVLGLIVYLAGMRSVMRRTRAVAADAVERMDAEAAKAAVPRQVWRDRIVAMLIMFVFALVFWMAFEQAANVMNLWADKHTNLHVLRAESPPPSTLDLPGDAAPAGPATGGATVAGGVQITAEQTQSINPMFIIIFAGIFGWFWLWLDRRGKQPSTPVKMTLGLFFVTLAYGLMMAAAMRENQPTRTRLAGAPDLNYGRYGATRLSYDPVAGELRMQGVLTDVDRLNVLADASPLKGPVEGAAKQLQDDLNAGRKPAALTVTLPDDAARAVRPEALPPGADWDEAERQLTLPASIVSERVRLPLLAAHAAPEFRAAVDDLYVQSAGNRISLLWLLGFYLIVTIGELCLSPVGLSFVTKTAPPKYVGLFMGLWFVMTGGVANFAAHTIGGYWGTMTPLQYFAIFGALTATATVIMIITVRFLKPMLHGVR